MLRIFDVISHRNSITMNIQETRLNSLLTIAERIQSFFTSSNDDLISITEAVIKRHNAIAARDCIAAEQYPFMIIASDPKQLLMDITDDLRKANNKIYRETLNPINIVMKFINQEYLLDLSGTRFCYAIKASIPSSYLLKTFACKIIMNVRSYRNFIDPDTNTMIEDKIKELHPLYDYATNASRAIGGKKRKASFKKAKSKGNVRLQILSQLLEYVRSTSEISSRVIFVNNLEECSTTAMNLIYTDYKTKTAIIDYLKALIQESFKQYTFKAFLHADFNLPYQFLTKKHSCLINDKNSTQATYLLNMYDVAMYMPVPCSRSVSKDSYIQVAHPVVKLLFLYIDMFMVERRLGEAHPSKHEQVYISKLTKAYNDLLTYSDIPQWIGYYVDEAYEKRVYNMKAKMPNPIDTILI